jgi:hypothetical protein
MRRLAILFGFGIFSAVHSVDSSPAVLTAASAKNGNARQGFIIYGGRNGLECLQFNSDRSISINRCLFDNPRKDNLSQIWDFDGDTHTIQTLRAVKESNYITPAPLERGRIFAVDDDPDHHGKLVEGGKLLITEYEINGTQLITDENEMHMESNGTGGDWSWIYSSGNYCLRATKGANSRTSTRSEWKIESKAGQVADSFIWVECRAEDTKIRFDFEQWI